MDSAFSEMLKKVEEAELVLVGIGEEFQYNWDIFLQNERYMEIEKEIEEREEYKWIVPFLYKMALEEYNDDNLANSYLTLKEILAERNYFIISTVIDDYVYKFGLKEERIVTPCGSFRKMQCDNNCNGQLMEFDNITYEKVKAYYDKKLSLEELHKPICVHCGQQLKFNQIGAAKYAEEGYLKQWDTYMKWLQGTVNKKVCVIELGVGMQFPSIIRWPFERIIYYNRKASLFRIHSSLYQMEEKIRDRGRGIKENPINFLSNGFVK
ncbi:MAG: hypothetical protein NC433_15910 [Clostridiales bacterium]|nr:hypothetical protein [Clostridiales bacterium]